MPNTVLGKVSVVPKGDYSASTTYYALDIVGYNGGSYLAMQQVTGVTPSNDGVNWMQLSGPGLPGENGTNGVTFTPSVSEAGVISWTNDGEEENPDPVDIMGPPGAAAGFGTVTATADNTSSETPSVDVQSSGPDTAKNFTFAFSGLKGNPGDTPDIEIGTVDTLEPGQDATADITGTTPNLTLSLGIPKGQPGTSVSRIERTSGTGAPGTTDTYTMYSTDGSEIGTFTVYNGTNGTGAGDFMADGSVPMTGALDMGGQRVTNVGAPTAPTDAVRQSDLEALSDEIDHILDGTTPVSVPAATEAKAGIVKPGEGMSVTEDGTLNVDDQLPAGGQTGQVLTKTESGEAWQDAPDGLPEGGETGQVLTKTSTGAQWDDVPSDLPAGGTDGQILTKTAEGVAWEDAPEGGVTSFNSRTGGITPQTGDYTAEMVGAVSEEDVGVANGVAELDSTGKVPASQLPSMDYIPTSEKGANSGVATLDASGKLTATQKPTYTADEVGARPDTWTPTASDVGAVPTTRTINSKPLSSNITLTADDVGAGAPATSATVTLTAAGWTGSAAPFSQQVSCSIVAADTPAIFIDPQTNSSDINANIEIVNAWALCTLKDPSPGAGTLTFYATEKPTINIPVKVGVA